MSITRHASFAFLLPALFFACQTPAPVPAPVAIPRIADAPATQPPSADSLRAVLWMQTSAEYEAITIQTYDFARRELDAALADPKWNAVAEFEGETAGKPPAIVLDLDETALDTSAFQARLLRDNQPFSEEKWHEFAMLGISRPIPAALDFLRYAHSRGVKIFYVTNRIASEEPPLRENLIKLGFPMENDQDSIYSKGERKDWQSSDKGPRRLFVASTYRVLFLFGDDLNDFVTASGKSIEERAKFVEQYKSNWGTKWFVLPNATYGSWERATYDNRNGLTEEEQIRLKRSKVRTDENYKP